MLDSYMKKRKARLLEINPNFARWNKSDILFFFIFIPVLLASVYLLPPSIKANFGLIPSNPTLIGIFFSNYTHIDFKHFLNNLIPYLLVIFLIFNVELNKRMFYTVSFCLFVILPFLSSLSTIYYTPNLPITYGFSAVASGFIGYLCFSVYNHLKNTSAAKLDIRFLVLIFMLNVTYVVLFNLTTTAATKLVVCLLTAIFLYQNISNMKVISMEYIKKTKVFDTSFRVGLYRLLLTLLTTLFLFVLPLLIPLVKVYGTSLINVRAHYFGYAFGIFLPAVIEVVPQAKDLTKGLSRRVSR